MSNKKDWSALSMSERADFIRDIAIPNNITNRKDIINLYNSFSGEEDTKTTEEKTDNSFWKKAGSTVYDVVELIDPTGISSWATPEGDLRQAISAYKNGNGSIGDIALETVGALPLIGKVGKAIKLGKGVSKAEKILSTVTQASDNAKKVDTLLELIPGVKKAATGTQAVTGTLMQAAADALNLSSDARRYTNIGTNIINNGNTIKDIIDVINVNDYNNSSYSVEPTKYITNDNYLEEHAKFRKAFEEFYPKAYYDSKGKAYTVGTGLTYLIDNNGKEVKVKRGDTITEEENLRQLKLREQLAEDYIRKKTDYWDKYHPEIKFQILDAMFNVGNNAVWNKSPKYQEALRRYEEAEGWNDSNYNLFDIFQHADWNLNDKKWLGIRSRMRRNPQAINPEDYLRVYNNRYRDSLYNKYSQEYEKNISSIVE